MLFKDFLLENLDYKNACMSILHFLCNLYDKIASDLVPFTTYYVLFLHLKISFTFGKLGLQFSLARESFLFVTVL